MRSLRVLFVYLATTVGPLLLTLGTVLVAIPVLLRRGVDMTRSRVPIGLLIAQGAMAVVAWAVIWGAPAEPNQIASGTCTATETPWVTRSLYLVLFGSSIVGGLAWATASVAERPGWARLLGFATVALVMPYVILVSWVWVALCGYSD